MYVVENDGLEPFQFELAGEVYELPAFTSLPFDDMLKYSDRAAAAQDEDRAAREALQIFLEVMEEHLPGVAKKLSMRQAANLANAYMNPADGTAAGESSPSSD